jgi:hypothetical protein
MFIEIVASIDLLLFSAGFLDTMKGIGSTIMDGDPKNVLERNAGLFLNCKVRLNCFFVVKQIVY